MNEDSLSPMRFPQRGGMNSSGDQPAFRSVISFSRHQGEKSEGKGIRFRIAKHGAATGRHSSRDKARRRHRRFSDRLDEPRSLKNQSLTPGPHQWVQRDDLWDQENGLAKNCLCDTVAFLSNHANHDVVAALRLARVCAVIGVSAVCRAMHRIMAFRVIQFSRLAFRRGLDNIGDLDAILLRPGHLLVFRKTAAFLLAVFSRAATAGTILTGKWLRPVFAIPRDRRENWNRQMRSNNRLEQQHDQCMPHREAIAKLPREPMHQLSPCPLRDNLLAASTRSPRGIP